MEYKVYKYVFPDGKVYIGMTHLKLEKRRDCGYQHNKELQNAMKNYGWKNYEHIVIADHLSKEEAEKIEIEQIAFLKSDNPKYGYNISKGGSKTFSGLSHTEKSKNKISFANKGRVFSMEHLKKLSNAHKGKNIGILNGNSVSVRQYSLSGELIATYGTTTEASDAVGIDRRGISDCIRGRQKTAGGFRWESVKEVV